MTTYWAEQDMVAHSEFRDGNVPANYQNLRVLPETLAALPEGVVKVYFRGDTAANQKDLLRYCAEGKSERFGVIEFAIGVDVTAEFKRAVAEVAEGEWQPLEREVTGTGSRQGRSGRRCVSCPIGRPSGKPAPPIAILPFASCWSKQNSRAWSPSSPSPA
ncbi:MAG: hypothetical protein HYX90_09165 [Chloroflexi bacterium]|nr:hypothetical protein [Chloroflexota bacterium]